MNQDTTQQSPQPGLVPEWFNPASPPSKPPTPKKSPMLAIIVLGVILVIGAVAAVVFIVTRQPSTCLDSSDYKELTGIGISADELSPTETFYNSYLLFNDNDLTYDNSTDGGLYGDSLIQKITDFYKAHPTKPILITISAGFLAPENESVTNQRIAAVQSSLLKAGVPESSIVAEGASYVAPEDAVEGNGDTKEISIAITSSTACR